MSDTICFVPSFLLVVRRHFLMRTGRWSVWGSAGDIKIWITTNRPLPSPHDPAAIHQTETNWFKTRSDVYHNHNSYTYKRPSRADIETSLRLANFVQGRAQSSRRFGYGRFRNLADDRSFEHCLPWFWSSHTIRNNLWTLWCRSTMSCVLTYEVKQEMAFQEILLMTCSLIISK